jgi:hypothetical protein
MTRGFWTGVLIEARCYGMDELKEAESTGHFGQLGRPHRRTWRESDQENTRSISRPPVFH